MPGSKAAKKRATQGALTAEELAQLVHSTTPEDLFLAAASASLTEDLALALLRRRDLPVGVVESLAKNAGVMKLRAVQNTVARHPQTPRHVSIPLIRKLYTFDLMEMALTPGVLPDVKRLAEDMIMLRLETISSGERMTLARRGSQRVAGALLLDPEPRVIAAALKNPRMNEGAILKALGSDKVKPFLIEAVIASERWSVPRDIRLALLRQAYTPLAKVIEYARSLPAAAVREVMRYSRQPANVKSYVTALLER